MGIRCLEDLTNLEDSRVLLRIDLDRLGEISSPVDDPRILGVFTTVDWLLERGARVTLCTSREDLPAGAQPALAVALEGALGRTIEPLHTSVGEGVASAGAGQPADRLLMLGNLAAEQGDGADDAGFAARLAQPFTHFVLDAFAACHRESTSVSGLAARFANGRRSIGRAMQTEVDALACLMSRPDRPNVAIVGGRVTPRRLAAARRLVQRADRFGAVGELGVTLLAARGHNRLANAVDPESSESAGQLLELADRLGVELILPTDLRVGRSRRAVKVDRFTGRAAPVDVGPATLGAMAGLLRDAETAFWQGETAVGEGRDGSRGGDRALAKALAAAPGFGVTAGQDTIRRVGGLGRLRSVSHVVCGGEAALAFIAGEAMPGLVHLED